MAPGPVMPDLAGPELQPEEREILRHPQVGGVILFSRNYVSKSQLSALTAEIHALRDPPLLIAVDQEGGRVQRFRQAFQTLPPAASLGKLHAEQPARAMNLAEQTGQVLAAELRAVGVDFSFAPVLDLDHGLSEVIGDRALSSDPRAVAALGQALMRGMKRAGMAAVGKHFPGHGAVRADSHLALPEDRRPAAEIFQTDMLPFARLIAEGLAAIMPAHVVYTQVDQWPAGFSARWLQDILRGRLGFEGAIISDDLNMAGAGVGGSPLERSRLALAAGCDLILWCNNREAVFQVLDGLETRPDPVSRTRLLRPGPGPALL